MKYLLIIALAFTQLSAFAQDSTNIAPKKINEFYLTLADFSPMNIHLKYKRQIGTRTFLKFGLINLSASRTELTNNTPSAPFNSSSNFSAGLEVGIEFRKQLNTKISFFHGPNLRYTYQQGSSNSGPSIPIQSSINNTFSIPYTAGFLFQIAPHLLFAAEINPAITYSNSRSQNSSISSNLFSFNLDNRGGLLSLVLRL